jgi:hypothetical protein
MNVPVRLAAFAGLLGLAFGAAALVGAVLDPTGEDARPAAMSEMAGGHGGTSAGDAEPAGLAVSQDGYTMQLAQTSVPPGQPVQFAFTINDGEGRPVRAGYEVESERELHLIVVRRDTTLFQHLHPSRDSAGTWSTRLVLPEAGVYRAYADFTIGGTRRTLATDLFVPGDFRPTALPPASGRADVDGYSGTLAGHDVRAGSESSLTFRVERSGRPVADLQPYLGAKGHLVALREGDLAYLHVHPDAMTGAAEEIRFTAEFPTPGRYRLFLQFSTGGRVHTAAYTLEVAR